MEFKAFEPGIFVNGRTINSIVEGFSVYKSMGRGILEECQIGEKDPKTGEWHIAPEKWYPQQNWLNAFSKISTSLGDTNLKLIGKKIPENAIFPPWVVDIHSSIKSINIAYHLNHSRDGKTPMFDEKTGKMQDGIGHYEYIPLEGNKKIICVCKNPYPTNFDWGIIEYMATKFILSAVISLDTSKPTRKLGADSDTFVITWR